MNPLEQLIQLDQHFTLWLNNLGSTGSGAVWLLLSDAKIWFPAYGAVMAYMLWKMGWKRGLTVVLSLFVCVLLTDQLSVVVKNGVERLRPCYNSWMIDHGVRWVYGQAHGFYGFFSSHAANTLGFATASTLGFRFNTPGPFWKAYGWGVAAWALLVCVSRVMMAAHFAGDVLVGMLFGLLVGALVALATRILVVKARL